MNGTGGQRKARGQDPKEERISENQGIRERMNHVEEERRQVREETHTRTQIGRGFGRMLSVLGMLVALAGLFTPGDVGPLGLAGMWLGVLGLVLGAYRMGAAAVALSWVEIFLGVLRS